MYDPIFILTLGHCGSSMFALLINQLGVPIHNKITGQHKDFGENADLVNENKSIVPEKAVVDPKIQRRLPRADLHGLLKDPRTLKCYAQWFQVYPDARYIFLSRNYFDVIQDLDLYSKSPQALKQRIRFFYAALTSCKNPLYVHYDNLSFDFENTMKKVADFCGVPYKPVTGWTPKYYGKIFHNLGSASR